MNEWMNERVNDYVLTVTAATKLVTSRSGITYTIANNRFLNKKQQHTNTFSYTNISINYRKRKFVIVVY